MSRPVLLRVSLFALLVVPGAVSAQACGTFFVDSNTPTGNFAKAISDVNSGGCPSGGFNTIIVDNSAGGFGDTVTASPLPQINRPVRIQMFSPASARHVIRSNNASSTAVNFALRASAPVEINDLVIEGGAGRAFFGGILLTGSAHNSEVRGVRIENVRHQGIFVSGVDSVQIRRSNNHPVEVLNSGWGVNADSAAFEPGILINGATNVQVFGAFLGVEPDGTSRGNCSYGIEVANSALIQIGSNVTSVNLRNHIGDNRFGGIRIRDSQAVSVLGNYIGLAPNGQTSVGNGGAASCFGATPPALPRGGVVVEDSSAVAIGSTTEDTGPVIVSNNRGVVIDNSHDVTMLRSLIGQRPTGQSAVNSLEGVRVENGSGSAGQILIGSTDPTRVNVIRGSASSLWGVIVAADAGQVNIRKNAIWGHASGAISRPGAPNPPVLDAAVSNTGVVSGSLTSVSDPGEIDFYADDGSQGRWYLGTHSVAANADSFSTVLNAPEFVPGLNVSATFTRIGAGSPGTSRLSAPLAITSEVMIYASGFESL